MATVCKSNCRRKEVIHADLERHEGTVGKLIVSSANSKIRWPPPANPTAEHETDEKKNPIKGENDSFDLDQC
ncbi:hypothetical protein F2P79_011713 [Pimephales promelas]|nr:hypothetical protein F2P79_011713 [Pimephales promelas]